MYLTFMVPKVLQLKQKKSKQQHNGMRKHNICSKKKAEYPEYCIVVMIADKSLLIEDIKWCSHSIKQCEVPSKIKIRVAL